MPHGKKANKKKHHEARPTHHRPLSPVGMMPGPPVRMMPGPGSPQLARFARTVSPYAMMQRPISPLPFLQNTPPGPMYAPQTAPGAPQPVIGVHIPLARCRVLYLGSAVPTETAEGLQALQQPLRERFPAGTEVQGIDCWLTIYSSGIAMQTAGDKDVVWFPISTLHISAAVKCIIKCIDDEVNSTFVPIDSAEAEYSSNPPIFAAIMRRTIGVKVLECHTFVTKTITAAMALVQSCTHAYKHKEAWNDGAPPPAEAHKIRQAHLFRADPVKDNVPEEFYKEPDPHGYFISNNGDKMKKYKIKTFVEGSTDIVPDFGPPGGPATHQPLPEPPQGYFNDWDENDAPVMNHLEPSRSSKREDRPSKRVDISDEVLERKIDSENSNNNHNARQSMFYEPEPDYYSKSFKNRVQDEDEVVYIDRYSRKFNESSRPNRVESGMYDRNISSTNRGNMERSHPASPGYSRKVIPMQSFARSMREEERLIDTDYGPDPYNLNYHGDAEFFEPTVDYDERREAGGMSGAELQQALGYLP